MRTKGSRAYDSECELVMGATRALGVLLVVVDGEAGSGVSFKTHDAELMRVLPAMLESIAAQMRLDAQTTSH